MMRAWKRGFAAAVLAAGLAPLLAGAALADMVVVRAAGGPLKAGQTLAAGAPVTLPAGASATLLSQDGKSVTLTGPFSGVPETAGASGGDPKVVSALSRLLTAGATDTGSLGVTRGTNIRDPYAIDPNGGPHCQVADRPPTFKRGMAMGESRLVLTSAFGTESVITFADGATEAAWPKSIPLIAGTYLLRPENRTTPSKLVLRDVPASVTGTAAVAAWMGDHGCHAQALALLNALP